MTNNASSPTFKSSERSPIFGSSVAESIINVVALLCGYCHVNAPQNVIQRRDQFTLFFVPLLSFSTKYVNECTNCGTLTAKQAQRTLTAKQAQRSLA